MSLLLDALKRAEQEKLARGDRPDLQIVGQSDAASSAPKPAARVEPPSRAAPPAAAAGAAALELQPIAAPAAPGGAKAQAAAQAVFQAKLPQPPAKSRRTVLIAVAVLIVLAMIAAAAYVWFAMKSFSPTATARPFPAPAAPQASSAITTAPASPASGPAVLAPEPAAAVPKAAPILKEPEQLAMELLRDAPAMRQPPLQLERSQEAPRVPGELASAYAALRNGDLAAARRGYQAVLSADSTNLDASLGLATAEARLGNIDAATAFYRRALELDSRNVTALAGLAALADPSRPGAVEARLREDVMRHPQSAALHFGLGNVYAAQSRWSEAQGEYFEAHRLDPASADIAHNLAVSLDHLGQAPLAAQFYRRALESARTQAAQFDRSAVARRLAELGP